MILELHELEFYGGEREREREREREYHGKRESHKFEYPKSGRSLYISETVVS